MLNQTATIVGGPCSVNSRNIDEIYKMSEIKVSDITGTKNAITGTRLVGLKSRTTFDSSGLGMGMDFDAVQENLNLLSSGAGYATEKLQQLPSIALAQEINRLTGMLIATEIMIPSMQMPLYAKSTIPEGKLMEWNPSVGQLGWFISEMAPVAVQKKWKVGIKNPKWLGEDFSIAESPEFNGETSLEKTWKGLASYAISNGKMPELVMIQRGVELTSSERGDFRNVPVHKTALRVKQDMLNRGQKVKMFFDPSHSYGYKLRSAIPEAIIEALKLEMPLNNENEERQYLYDGILVETGTSETDTNQHITLQELEDTVNRIGEFRPLEGR